MSEGNDYSLERVVTEALFDYFQHSKLHCIVFLSFPFYALLVLE